MTRRVTLHQARSKDGESLQIITVFESGVKKEQVKLENRYSKRHEVLVPIGDSYDYKSKRA